jgi:stage V sporulation protein S
MKSCTIEKEVAPQATYLHFAIAAHMTAVMDVIKVSGSSRTSAVAGAIAGVFRENKRAEVQAIGAGAVNQAVKALVLARGYLAEDGYDVICAPEFADVEIDEKVRTAVRLVVEERIPSE